MYLYELHCHESVSSACARWSPREMVEFYLRQGYTGIVVCDHFVNGNSAVDRSLPWQEQLVRFCDGYEQTKAVGDELGLDVFFAFEYSAGWGGPRKNSICGCDFLIYGLSPQWLQSLDAAAMELSVNDFMAMVRREGGTVVQAHPFRLVRNYMDHISLFPTYTDGVEIINGNPNNMGAPNRMARAYAREYGFFTTAGTDSHFPCKYLAATLLPERAETMESLLDALRTGKAHHQLIKAK